MVATLQGHRDAVKDPKHRAKLWARPATSEEPQQVDALLTWVENLWRELKIKEEDRHLFLEANNLPSRNLVDRLQRTVYAELVSSETPKRPRSASSSRPKTAPFPDARRQKDVDQRCAPLAAHARLLLRFRRATLRALREIESREKLVKRIKDCFRRYRGAPPVTRRKKRTSTIYDDDEAQPPSSETQIKEALADLKATLRPLNEATARVVAAVAAWRCYQWRPEPFLWKGRDYLEKCTSDLHFLGECACPEGVRKPDRRLAAALGPWASHPQTNCVWWHERTKSESAREAQKNAELRGRDSLRRWIRHTLDVAAASREEDRTAAADAAARACLKLYAPGKGDLPDLSSARTLLLDEPWLRSGVEKERVRLMRAKVPLPCLRWLPPCVDAPAVLAAANVFHGAKSYQQLQAAERQLRVKCEGEFTRRLKERAATDPDAFKKKKRRRRRRKSVDAPAPAPLIKSVTFQTAQHATMAANIFAKKDQLGLRKLQLSFRLRRDKRLTEIAHAKKAAHALKRKQLARGGAAITCLEFDDSKRFSSQFKVADEVVRRQIDYLDLRLDEPQKHFDLGDIPGRGDRDSRGCELRERLPPCSGVDAPRDAMRSEHWEKGLLSGVYAYARPPSETPAVKERKKKQKARYTGGWGSPAPKKKAPPEARAPPTPQAETPQAEEEQNEELRAATYHPRDGYLVDGSKASADELVWCFRKGQRLALVQGRMPHERVRAICTVVAYANGTYSCVCDDGEGITLDPTGHRTKTIEIPLDKKREVRGLQRTHRIAEAPAPAPSASEPSLGFDIDESREVARVDPGSWAEELGIVHGWVLKSVDKNRIADHQSFVDAALTIAKVRRKGSVSLEFEVPSFELCKPSVEYHTGQRLTVLYHGRWRDAMTLKKPWEEHPRVEERHRARLRVFMNRSLVETCCIGLNHMNHALLFGEAPDNEAAHAAWREERPDWGDMFDAVRSRCLSREKRGKRRQSYHALVNGLTGRPKWASSDYDGPKYQAESFSKSAPRVYTWKRPSGWGYTESPPCAIDGTLWESIADLPSLVKVLLSRKGDDATRGSQSQCRVLLVNGPQEDTAALSRQRRMLLEQRASFRRSQSLTPSHTPQSSKRGSFDQTPPATPGNRSGTTTPKVEGEPSFFEEQQRRAARADELIEAIPLNEIGGVETKKLMAEMAVKQAVRQLCANWRKRSMQMYADVRTSKGHLRSLMMALSATRQFGDPSTHFIPYLVKAGSLHRVARKSGKGSVLEHYFETCYGQSYRPRYRFLLQALHTNRLVLLIDATDQKDAKSKAVEAFTDTTANSTVDDFLLQRVAVEVPRCVITGDFSDTTLEKLRQRFATLEVRQGLKSDHDDGLDCWYAAQNEHFSFVPTEKVDKEDDETSFGLTAAPYRGTAFSEEEDLSPMKVYGPGRIYAETSYRLLRGSQDASEENKEDLIELLKTTKRQPIFGGKIEEAAAGPVKRMPGSRASRD